MYIVVFNSQQPKKVYEFQNYIFLILTAIENQKEKFPSMPQDFYYPYFPSYQLRFFPKKLNLIEWINIIYFYFKL